MTLPQGGCTLDEGVTKYAGGTLAPVMTSTVSQKGRIARVSAVVLAAGASARMGRPKQLLPLGANTVLAQTLENVLAARVDEIVLVLGSSASAIRQQLPRYQLERFKVVVNQDYGQGMATSLRAGLSALDPRSDAALIVLGDQPFIRPHTLNQIVEGYGRSRASIVIPSYLGDRGNPVLLDRSVFPEVMALEGDIGCRAIFGNHLEDILKVEVEDPGVLLDIDDQGDYDRLKQLHERSGQ
jgi:molybdenum cofactor cytidylyltransferase